MPRSTSRTMDNLRLQRRHYQFIAEVIKDWKEDPTDDLALVFARALRGTNSGYDSNRFLEACGGITGTRCLLCQSCDCHHSGT